MRLGLGGHLDLTSYSLAQGDVANAGGDPGPPAGPRVRIVGIVRRPFDLGNQGAAGGAVILTPAFDHAYLHRIALYQLNLRVRTRHSDADLARGAAAARRIFVGIPGGLIAGRLVWRLVADGLGVSSTATIPTLGLLLAIPAVLALVNLIALFPARAAARTRPAVALRSE